MDTNWLCTTNTQNVCALYKFFGQHFAAALPRCKLRVHPDPTIQTSRDVLRLEIADEGAARWLLLPDARPPDSPNYLFHPPW